MNEASQVRRDRRPLKLRSFLWMQRVARGLAAAGISPNAVSIFGIVASAASGAAFFFTYHQSATERVLWLLGAALIVVRILANTLDGMIAVECGKASRVGKLYNEAPDRISDAVILIGAGYADGGSVELGYLTASLALFVAYVRTLAETAGAPSDFRGPMAKGHRMITVIITAIYMSIAPAAWHIRWGPQRQWGIMAIALLIMTLGEVLTAARRLRSAADYLRALD